MQRPSMRPLCCSRRDSTTAILSLRDLPRRSWDNKAKMAPRQMKIAHKKTQNAMKYNTVSHRNVNMKKILRVEFRRSTSLLTDAISTAAVVGLLLPAAISAPLSKTGTCSRATAAAVQEKPNCIADMDTTRMAMRRMT